MHNMSSEFSLRMVPKKKAADLRMETLLMRGQRRMTGLVCADREATITQMATLYNCGE